MTAARSTSAAAPASPGASSGPSCATTAEAQPPWLRPRRSNGLCNQAGHSPPRFCQPDQLLEPAAASVSTYMLPPPFVPIANTCVRPADEPTPIASPEGQVPPRFCQPDQLASSVAVVV